MGIEGPVAGVVEDEDGGDAEVGGGGKGGVGAVHGFGEGVRVGGIGQGITEGPEGGVGGYDVGGGYDAGEAVAVGSSEALVRSRKRAWSSLTCLTSQPPACTYLHPHQRREPSYPLAVCYPLWTWQSPQARQRECGFAQTCSCRARCQGGG